MAEYIDKDYVTKCLMESWANSGIPSDAKNKMLKWLNKAPTAADVQPVRIGRWELDVLDGIAGYRPVCIVCSECNIISCAGFPYCPNCGARMDGTEMYKKLIAELREYWNDGTEEIRGEAADAIEELQKQLREEKVDNVNLTGWLAEEHAKHLWIPVTERLPDDRTDVVAVCNGGAFDQLQWTELAFYCIKEDGTAEFFGIDKSITNARVTHWMPLPEPPKGETE